MIRKIILTLSFLVLVVSSASAKEFPLFDIEKRKQELQTGEYTNIKDYCLYESEKLSETEGLKPLKALKVKEGYGTDRSLNDFAWYLMVNAGRVLAGDDKAEQKIIKVLLDWSENKALYDTEQNYDPYYSLKRGLLTIITSYAVVESRLDESQRKQIETWIDTLVRRIDFKFDKIIDENNHRYLADSVLAIWGAYIGDDELYNKGVERFNIALEQMRADGSLPLEARRGARAMWYTRQSLADLTLIAETAKSKGDNLYEEDKDGKNISLLMNYFISGVKNNSLNLKYVSENYIPGPSDNFLKQDLGILKARGGRRHLMAFAEAYLNSNASKLSRRRLENLMEEITGEQRPLIDDYMGGNATCFWAKP